MADTEAKWAGEPEHRYWEITLFVVHHCLEMKINGQNEFHIQVSKDGKLSWQDIWTSKKWSCWIIIHVTFVFQSLQQPPLCSKPCINWCPIQTLTPVNWKKKSIFLHTIKNISHLSIIKDTNQFKKPKLNLPSPRNTAHYQCLNPHCPVDKLRDELVRSSERGGLWQCFGHLHDIFHHPEHQAAAPALFHNWGKTMVVSVFSLFRQPVPCCVSKHHVIGRSRSLTW